MRAAVYGAGALGTVLGAALTRSGADVELVSRDQEHVDALNRSGARITGLREWTVPVKACTPQQMSGRYDVILLLTKQMANTAALPRLAEHLAPDGIVCALQNGIPEPELAAALGADRVAGGVVTWNAVRIGAGQARLAAGKLAAFQDRIAARHRSPEAGPGKGTAGTVLPGRAGGRSAGSALEQAAHQCGTQLPGKHSGRKMRCCVGKCALASDRAVSAAGVYRGGTCRRGEV